MAADVSAAPLPAAPLWGELRYSAELACLLADRSLRSPRPAPDAPPVMLIPGFMAGDSSLAVMRSWLRRRGHAVARSGMRANVGCSERIVTRLQVQLREFSSERRTPVVLVGQSRGGSLARALAVREPDHVCGLVMLGSPVRDPLAVAAPVMASVRWLARLGDLRIPGLFSSACHDGDCCAAFREELAAPLHPGVRSVAVHSRSDAIVDWRACIDSHCEQVEVDSSHCGMSVHPAVYRVLERALDAAAAHVRAGVGAGATG
jgi:pimeloyl-ACP methyl ester carboxylesterase